MWLSLLLLISFVLYTWQRNSDHAIEVTFKLLDANGEVQSHQLVIDRNMNKAVAEIIRKEPTMSGNDIIAEFTAFSNLYTESALQLDQIRPVDEEQDEFVSSFNYYQRPREDLSVLRFALCVSHFQEDLNWLRTMQSPYIIVTKNPTPRFIGNALQIGVNRGNEVSSYLRFIVEYYEVLPEFTLFLHGHNQDWHQYYPVHFIIEHLALQKGFESVNNVVVFPYDDKPDARLKALWPWLFQDELGDMPSTGFKDKCCAQFVVHRDRIRLRSRAFYQRLYDYVVADDQDDAREGDGYHCSMSYVLEMVWHYIFGEQPFMDYSKSGHFQLTSTSELGQPLNLYV